MEFLVLQARRPGDAALEQEQLAFRETLGEGYDVRYWDLLRGPPPFDAVDRCDAVMVGGAGEFGVGDAGQHPWLRRFIDFCGALADRGKPAFFSCFGFQALVVAAGGRVEPDPSRAELGTFLVSLTEAGRRDPVFAPLAPGFHAQLGHKDHALGLPEGFVHLASSARSPYQALRVEGRPIYATQFHPELSQTANRKRFLTYREAYSQPELPEGPEAILASFRETPEASSLLRRFAAKVLAGEPGDR